MKAEGMGPEGWGAREGRVEPGQRVDGMLLVGMVHGLGRKGGNRDCRSPEAKVSRITYTGSAGVGIADAMPSDCTCRGTLLVCEATGQAGSGLAGKHVLPCPQRLPMRLHAY